MFALVGMFVVAERVQRGKRDFDAHAHLASLYLEPPLWFRGRRSRQVIWVSI